MRVRECISFKASVVVRILGRYAVSLFIETIRSPEIVTNLFVPRYLVKIMSIEPKRHCTDECSCQHVCENRSA